MVIKELVINFKLIILLFNLINKNNFNNICFLYIFKKKMQKFKKL